MPTRIWHSSAKSPQLKEVDAPRDGAWLYVEQPTEEELTALSEQLSLDIALLKDGVDPNESPRIERDNGNIYIFTRYSLPQQERLTTSPLLIVYTENMLVTVINRSYPELEGLLAKNPEITTSRRAQLVLAMLNEINLGYKRRIYQVSRRIWQIRGQLHDAAIANRDFVNFIDIEEDLNDFLLVLEPIGGVLENLLNGRYMRLYEEDRDLIEDLSLGTDELIQLASSRLTTIRNIREAYSTIATNNLNNTVRLMTAVTIMIGFFTLVTGFYGMNINLPVADNPDSYVAVLVFMLISVTVLTYLFRRKQWF